MAKRTRATIVEVKSNHSVFLSHPQRNDLRPGIATLPNAIPDCEVERENLL